MAEEDRDRETSAAGGEAGPRREAEGIRDEAPGAEQVDDLPTQSPLFHAQRADRYQRQELIRKYESRFDCRLAVVRDAIFPDSVTLFEELVYDADPTQDLHLILGSPGGDGETAVRLARQAQSRCERFVVIVPDQAKSAATLLAMGAHEILMGPTSDLGPVDAQYQLEEGGGLVSAKEIIAAVESAEAAVQSRPETYPLHASLLSNVTALMVQRARSAMARTDQIGVLALRSNPARTPEEAEELWRKLKSPLSEEPADHGAIFDADDAIAVGLPVTKLDPASVQWQIIWRLWAKYEVLGARVYEGHGSSQTLREGPPTDPYAEGEGDSLSTFRGQ
jgi:hypothetical protein